MKKQFVIFIILTILLSTSIFAQTNSYTVWVNNTEIFTHHETDAGDTVEIKKSYFTNNDTLTAMYHHKGDAAHGNTSRLTLKNDLNRLIRGETILQGEAFHKASIPMSLILKDWGLVAYKYISISMVVINEGESAAHGYKIGVLRLVD